MAPLEHCIAMRHRLPRGAARVEKDFEPPPSCRPRELRPFGGTNDEGGKRGRYDMLETTIAGSLPKPAWLAKPRMLWAPWLLAAEELAEAKRDATLLALKQQEDA